MAIDVPMLFESESLLWLVKQVYSQEECAQFIRFIEQSSPKLATNNLMYRNQDRVMIDDHNLAKDLFNRLKANLPPKMGDLRLMGLNERLRFYRYQVGQSFSAHMDHWYRPNEDQISLHTVLVYFNENFKGGETIFQEQLEQTVIPETGMAAIFQHKIRHEGAMVYRGTKYAMRTEVIYGK